MSKADALANAKLFGVTFKVSQRLLVPREHLGPWRPIQIAEPAQHPVGVGEHFGPDAAMRRTLVPLPSEPRALLEKHWLKAVGKQETRRDKPSRPGADYGNVFRVCNR